MGSSVPLKCTCGEVRGVVDLEPARDSRVVCMCDDCQTAAHWFGRADELLDVHGGTEVYQVTPRQVRFTAGRDQIRCMRLSPKGLMRWYSACCKTPLANTLASPKVPFVGLPHLAMDHEGNGRSADEALGPVRAACNARFAVGTMPEGAHKKAPIGLILRAARHLLSGVVRGAAEPSPLFDAQTRSPISEPTIIPLEERKRLRARCGPTPTADAPQSAT